MIRTMGIFSFRVGFRLLGLLFFKIGRREVLVIEICLYY